VEDYNDIGENPSRKINIPNEDQDHLNKYQYFTAYKGIENLEEGARITQHNSSDISLFKEMKKQDSTIKD